MAPVKTVTTRLPRLSNRTKQEAAGLIAEKLLRLAEGGSDDPATWRQVAERVGCRAITYHAPGCGRGEYAATGVEGTGIIAVNTAYSPTDQVRAWIHEIAHHELRVWIPPQLADAADVYRYADNPRDARHQIARLVERLVVEEERKAQ